MTAAHCNDWCGPGSHHMPPCPAAPSEPPADLSDWERERQDAARFLPPAEAQQDDERPGYVKVGAYWVPIDPLRITCCGAPDPGVCHRFGICRMDGSHPTVAARPPADTETLRPVLLAHHPIMRSEDGPFSGCRCGQVRLGEDVIAHVAAEVLAALGGTGA